MAQSLRGGYRIEQNDRGEWNIVPENGDWNIGPFIHPLDAQDAAAVIDEENFQEDIDRGWEGGPMKPGPHGNYYPEFGWGPEKVPGSRAAFRARQGR